MVLYTDIDTGSYTFTITGASEDVNIFRERVADRSGVPGLPKFDPNRVVRTVTVTATVHHELCITYHVSYTLHCALIFTQ